MKKSEKSGPGTIAKYVFQVVGPRMYDPDAEGVLYSNHPWPESNDSKERASQQRWHTDIYMSGLSASGQEQQVLQGNVGSDPRQWVGMELFAIVRFSTYQGVERGEIASYVHRADYERFPGRMPESGETAQVSAAPPAQFGGAPGGQSFATPAIGQTPGGWQQASPAPSYAQAPGFGNGVGGPGAGPGINPALAMTRPR